MDAIEVERDSGKRKNKRRRKREWLDLIFEHKKSSGRERQRRKDPLRDARGGVLGGLGLGAARRRSAAAAAAAAAAVPSSFLPSLFARAAAAARAPGAGGGSSGLLLAALPLSL